MMVLLKAFWMIAATTKEQTVLGTEGNKMVVRDGWSVIREVSKLGVLLYHSMLKTTYFKKKKT